MNYILMKLAVYAVRYSEPIEPFIQAYYDCSGVREAELCGTLSLTIINNFGVIEHPTVKILNNVVRPDFSTGHLARSWNQCILNAFKSLAEPAVDALIAIQIDSRLSPDWLQKVYELPRDCHYLSIGRGDECQFIRPECIETVGLFDERYCNIGYQEMDYFIRVFIGLRNHGAYLDNAHGRYWNPWTDTIHEYHFIQRPLGDIVKNEAHRKSEEFHTTSANVFLYKWGFIKDWSINSLLTLPVDVVYKKEFKYYPYFENYINPNLYILN